MSNGNIENLKEIFNFENNQIDLVNSYTTTFLNKSIEVEGPAYKVSGLNAATANYMKNLVYQLLRQPEFQKISTLTAEGAIKLKERLYINSNMPAAKPHVATHIWSPNVNTPDLHEEDVGQNDLKFGVNELNSNFNPVAAVSPKGTEPVENSLHSKYDLFISEKAVKAIVGTDKVTLNSLIDKAISTTQRFDISPN